MKHKISIPYVLVDKRSDVIRGLILTALCPNINEAHKGNTKMSTLYVLVDKRSDVTRLIKAHKEIPNFMQLYVSLLINEVMQHED